MNETCEKSSRVSGETSGGYTSGANAIDGGDDEIGRPGSSAITASFAVFHSSTRFASSGSVFAAAIASNTSWLSKPHSVDSVANQAPRKLYGSAKSPV